MQRFRFIIKSLPTLLLAFVMAVAVWILAVTASDPLEARSYPHAVTIQVVGLDPHMVITNELPYAINLELSAPHSIWSELENQVEPVKAFLDLSTLEAGIHQVTVQVQVSVKPVRVLLYSPSTVEVNIEQFTSREFDINLQTVGQPALGFQVAQPVLDYQQVTISGPQSLVDSISQVSALLDITRVRENVAQTLNVVAVDAAGTPVSGISLTPSQLNVTGEVKPLSGYRNIAVKVVWTGQPAKGYQLTNISVDPPAVTVFSSDPILVENLPGYLETLPLDLTNANENFSTQLNLNLPLGVAVIEKNSVQVSVGIVPIEGSLTLPGVNVEVINLAPGLQAAISPQQVTIILAGPLPALDALTAADIRVVVDLSNTVAGTFQKKLQVELTNPVLQVVSVVPESVSVVISSATQNP